MITSKMLSNYKELQEYNNHGELLSRIAADLGLEEYEKVFNSINIIHDIEGYISHDLSQVRDRYRGELKQYIVNNLSNSESEIILQYV